MINKFLQDAIDEFCRPTLIEGQLYAFKLNGYMCSGIYLDTDDDNSEGSFYCNGKPVCKVSEADHIKHMIDSAIHSSHMMYHHLDEALLREVMLIIQNAVETACSRGSDEAVDGLIDAHEAICKRLSQTQGEQHDSLQTPYPHLSASTLPTVVSLEPPAKHTVIDLATGIRIRSECNIKQPFDVKRSIKSIGCRIYRCIQISDFERAARLHKVYSALKEASDGHH
ncbi:hypothetical protein LO872_000676 [Vibrio fluvialis]|nr:hypothetical protein [Vibrio fluvialis]